MDSRVERPPEKAPHEETTGADLPLIRSNELEGVARAIIRESLDPEGLDIPERELREWITALGRLYDMGGES